MRRPIAPLFTTVSLSATRGQHDSVIAPHLGGEHGPLLDRVLAGEYLSHRCEHVARGDIGHEAEAPLIDADQRHAVQCQMPGRIEHAAVPALHHGQVCLGCRFSA